MKVRKQRKYASRSISQASEQDLIASSSETRSRTRLSQFSKLINILRAASYYANLLEHRETQPLDTVEAADTDIPF